MGSSTSKEADQQQKLNEMKNNKGKSFVDKIKSNVKDEVARNMMLQREVQMAVNIAKARDTLQIYGTIYTSLVGGIITAKVLKKPIPPVVAVPIFAGGVM